MNNQRKHTIIKCLIYIEQYHVDHFPDLDLFRTDKKIKYWGVFPKTCSSTVTLLWYFCSFNIICKLFWCSFMIKNCIDKFLSCVFQLYPKIKEVESLTFLSLKDLKYNYFVYDSDVMNAFKFHFHLVILYSFFLI